MTKKIEAIIREDRFNDVKDALRKVGIIGLNVTEVRGHGRGGGIVLTGRTGTYQVDMLLEFNSTLYSAIKMLKKRLRRSSWQLEPASLETGLFSSIR